MTRILLALLLSLAPALAQERQVQGLTAPVEIITDRWGIPHINASSHEDAFFGQGYAAATARLWQLDLTRRRQLGRLAEAFGPGFLPRAHAPNESASVAGILQAAELYALAARRFVEAA